MKKIGVVGKEDGGSSPVKIFSDEEQFELFVKAYEDFSGAMDFTNLINYFKDLIRVLNDKKNKGRNR